MSWKRFRLGCALIAFAVLTACSLPLKKPEVQVAGIELGHATLLQQDLLLTLRVQNPNPIGLDAQGVSFDLTSHGRKLASGQSNQPISIPAMGEGTIALTVHASVLDLLQAAKSALSQGTGALDYQLTGQLAVLGGWGHLPFSHEGQLKLTH